jgi:hypothetical protein
MFGKKEKFNPFISRMEDYEKRALKGCSEDIYTFVTDFFKKCKNSKVKWEGNSIDWNIERTAEIAMYLSFNTRPGEKISEADLRYIEAMFKELELLRSEILKSNPSDKRDYYYDKVSCLSEFLCKNMVNMHYGEPIEEDEKADPKSGMILKDYKHLLLATHIINEQYGELTKRGFSLHNIIYPFRESFEYDRMLGKEKSEEEKFRLFMGLLDGTMKFHPQFEYKAVAQQVVPVDFNEALVNHPESDLEKEFSLEKAQEQISTDPEGIQKRLEHLFQNKK